MTWYRLVFLVLLLLGLGAIVSGTILAEGALRRGRYTIESYATRTGAALSLKPEGP